jgi:hypothetical protein
MRKIFIAFMFLYAVNLSAQVPCSVDSIGIKDCVIGEYQYIIPVFVGTTGIADSVKVEATGLDYDFQTQYFRMYQSFSNPGNVNSFHFPIYSYADQIVNNVDVKVTLIGGTCDESTDFLMVTLGIDDPLCFCTEFRVLTGTLNANKLYYASDYISSSQNILNGNTVLYSANNYVELTDGFILENDAIVEIKDTGCVLN